MVVSDLTSTRATHDVKGEEFGAKGGRVTGPMDKEELLFAVFCLGRAQVWTTFGKKLGLTCFFSLNT